MSYVVAGGSISWFKTDYKVIDVFLDKKEVKKLCELKNDRSQYRCYEIKTKVIK